ncbi:centlein isoform X2 [Thalassophryne amazonica]|uniref:centlein isoform X2 n=1 Tax=Thalassophryne amazonica TaxID=390379 RepID=UPI00147094B2|nr:centlein isoform X2 [Thalassophryne amazonica]
MFIVDFLKSSTMSANDETRMLVLEKQVKSLSDELLQCQADKEFVWSLWKRLQVANPDLTQAVSLVVEREKHKAELKDRKVLEILQSKDSLIQDLEQKVVTQQQEINNLAKRKMTVDEESIVIKQELTALREQLFKFNEEFKEMKTKCWRQDEEEQQVVRVLEEEKEGLASCCAALRADLEERQRQVNNQQDQRDTALARVMELEEELNRAWQEVSRLQNYNTDLVTQVSNKEKVLSTKEAQLNQVCCELAEVQTLYRQSTEHAAEQSHLIKQLEGLNLDTQRVLRNQEEAHTADTTSYQRLYNELSQCYQALVSSEAKLRQSHQALGSQLAQKDQYIFNLQAQLQQQQQQEQLQLQRQQAPQTTLTSSSHRQTNFKGAPVQRSRSLSPANNVEKVSEVRRGAQQQIQDLGELLKLKMEENDELRRVHDRRRDRLCLIQTHYKAIRDQLKEMEESNGLPDRRMPFAKPRQLTQENSDAVWNELTYMKQLTRKLSMQKANLEEESDMLRVQAAMDRATVKELRLCLSNEHQELLHRVMEEHQVKSNTPKKSSISSERMEQSLKKIKRLERRMGSLEETTRLMKEKEQLLEANGDLVNKCYRLEVAMEQQKTQETVREKLDQVEAQAVVQGEMHRNKIISLEAHLAASKREATKLHHQVLKLRRALGILRAARDFYRNHARGPVRGGREGSIISGKVKFKARRLRSPRHQSSHQTVRPNQAVSWQGCSPNTRKHEWEDMSTASTSDEEYSDSLNSVPARKPQHRCRKFYTSTLISNTEAPAAESNRKQLDILIQDDKQHEPRDQGKRGVKRRRRRKRMLVKTQRRSSSTLQQRVESLQRHVDILRSARNDAVHSTRELRRANEELTTQLHTLTEKLHCSKQLTQKLTSDLSDVKWQKKILEVEREQWRQVTIPQQTSSTALICAECSCQGGSMSTPDNPATQVLEAEVRRLQTKLKTASAEVTRQVTANKTLRGQLREKDDILQQLQDKIKHVERDVTMKKQLVEDLKTRLKFLQEMEKSYRGQVKALSEEATNRKSFIESLKRRLSVATTEKNQYVESCTKLKEDLEKKEQRIHALQACVGTAEHDLAALEQTANNQMEDLSRQSSQALDTLHRQLEQAFYQVEQLQSFFKALASEILLDIQEVKQQLMKRRRLRQAKAVAAKGGLSAKSMIKAKSIAASILNMSENDLADIMDTDQVTEASSNSFRDQEWLDHLNHILQQKIPSASQLMEAVRVKMKERKVLTEELATIATPVSENA